MRSLDLIRKQREFQELVPCLTQSIWDINFKEFIMGGGEMGVGESPASPGSFHGISGGLPLKKKVMPKKSPAKLQANKKWKASFSKFNTAGGKRG